MNNLGIIVVRTRTGKETHYGLLGSTVTICGTRLRALGGQMIVRGVTKPTCEKCKFGIGIRPQNPLTPTEKKQVKDLANTQFVISRKYSTDPVRSAFWFGRSVGMGKIAQKFNPLNGYIGFYKGKKYEIYSDTSLHAQQEIAKKYNIKKPYEITIMLAEKEGKSVTHAPEFNPQAKVHPQALESLKRYKDDLKAGHVDAAEYWRGQAGAYFTANPSDYHVKKVKGSHGISSYYIVKGSGPHATYITSFSTKEEALRELRELKRKETEEFEKHFTANPGRWIMPIVARTSSQDEMTKLSVALRDKRIPFEIKKQGSFWYFKSSRPAALQSLAIELGLKMKNPRGKAFKAKGVLKYKNFEIFTYPKLGGFVVYDSNKEYVFDAETLSEAKFKIDILVFRMKNPRYQRPGTRKECRGCNFQRIKMIEGRKFHFCSARGISEICPLWKRNPEVSKEPWLMTKAEYKESKRFLTKTPFPPTETEFAEDMDRWHKTVITKALFVGKSVPSEVLKDYPELKSKKNPILETLGHYTLAGIGFGTGYKVVDWLTHKINKARKNPMIDEVAYRRELILQIRQLIQDKNLKLPFSPQWLTTPLLEKMLVRVKGLESR